MSITYNYVEIMLKLEVILNNLLKCCIDDINDFIVFLSITSYKMVY